MYWQDMNVAVSHWHAVLLGTPAAHQIYRISGSHKVLNNKQSNQNTSEGFEGHARISRGFGRTRISPRMSTMTLCLHHSMQSSDGPGLLQASQKPDSCKDGLQLCLY